jgi:hypothetical protein
MNATEILRRGHAGAAREYVTFTVDGREYQATVVTTDGASQVTQLHRVHTERTPIEWRSISASSPRFARVAAALFEAMNRRSA